MANTALQAGPQISIPVDALQSDIARYSRQGDMLTIELKNGDTITINDFYKPAQDGSLHSLTLRDNTNVDIQGEPEEELSPEDQAGLAAAGLAGLGLAMSGGGGGGGGSPSKFSRIQRPRFTGDVRVGLDVTVRMLPCVSNPPRGVPVSETR